ncbi:MAG: cytochrome c biogenesis protein CcdA, partial [Chloroflexota bacterium]
MDELIRAFSLGNAAILTNACLLPLYPGLIAFLAQSTGSADSQRSRRATGWFGVLVLAGILTMMTLIGLVLYVLEKSFGDALSILLPIIYGIVIISGVLLLLDRNPFARLATAQAPVLRNPYITAYVYGLFFGPMTLPCTGPLILSAFALGAGNAAELANGLLFFLAFGLGFGWPLLLLPLIALPLQRRLVGWLTLHHTLLNRASGVLLIAIGVFGALTELLPNYLPIDNVTLAP